MKVASGVEVCNWPQATISCREPMPAKADHGLTGSPSATLRRVARHRAVSGIVACVVRAIGLRVGRRTVEVGRVPAVLGRAVPTFGARVARLWARAALEDRAAARRGGPPSAGIAAIAVRVRRARAERESRAGGYAVYFAAAWRTVRDRHLEVDLARATGGYAENRPRVERFAVRWTAVQRTTATRRREGHGRCESGSRCERRCQAHGAVSTQRGSTQPRWRWQRGRAIAELVGERDATEGAPPFVDANVPTAGRASQEASGHQASLLRRADERHDRVRPRTPRVRALRCRGIVGRARSCASFDLRPASSPALLSSLG